nr:hypothetical protein [uncultured Pedobacter sp.]
MGNRPQREHRPLFEYSGKYEQTVRTIDLIRKIFNNALKQRLWVFEPSVKRWFSPEEFMEMYERYDNLDPKWIAKIEVRDPMEGLEAADTQVESILARKAILTKKIIDYERAKQKSMEDSIKARPKVKQI